MERVTGVGGIFFKAENPEALAEWYASRLGVKVEHGCATFEWRDAENPAKLGQTVWTPFKKDTTYFAPSSAPFMVNYRVKDLHAMLAQLRDAGATVDDKVEESEYGKFGWVMDPEGNRIELWEAPAGEPLAEPDLRK